MRPSLGGRRESSLDAVDLERLALAAYLSGRYEAGEEAWTRAHQGVLATGDVARSARCAFWLGHELMIRGEKARAGGWFAQAGRLLEEHGIDCVERGYLLVPAATRSIMGGNRRPHCQGVP